MNTDYIVKRNKHFADQLSKHLGIPIHHSSIEYSKVGKESPTRFGINRKTGKLRLEHNIAQPKLSIHDSIKPYLSHLKRLHRLAPNQDPRLLHYAATSFGNKDSGDVSNSSYNSAMVMASDKYRPKFTKLKGQDEPGTYYANVLSRLKELGVKGITKLNKENFETHRRHHNIKESSLVHSSTHRGYIHEGKLYLTQSLGYPQTVGSSLAAADIMANKFGNIKKPPNTEPDYSHFEQLSPGLRGVIRKYGKKGTPEEIRAVYKQMHPNRPMPPLTNVPPPLPSKKAVKPPPLPPIPRKTPPPLPT